MYNNCVLAGTVLLPQALTLQECFSAVWVMFVFPADSFSKAGEPRQNNGCRAATHCPGQTMQHCGRASEVG